MSIKLKRTDEEMKWKTLSSEYVVKKPWMTVRKDKLLLPDGRVKDDYWSLEYPDWINVIATTKDGHYIFERQYRHGLDCVAWEIPAGVIEKGEEPLARGVEREGEQHFDATEDIDVYFLTAEEVRGILERGEVVQSMMAAPLWRLAATLGL